MCDLHRTIAWLPMCLGVITPEFAPQKAAFDHLLSRHYHKPGKNQRTIIEQVTSFGCMVKDDKIISILHYWVREWGWISGGLILNGMGIRRNAL